jgi:hypothetical protein
MGDPISLFIFGDTLTKSAVLLPSFFSSSFLPSAFILASILVGLPLIGIELDDPVGIKQFQPTKLRPYYDYIVVGGGSAGCVVANRLSEDPNNVVLLLDAGGDGTFISDIPGAIGVLYGNPALDWSYKTEPENNACLAMNDRKCSWHRGKSIGGTSTINGMIYIRGAKEDYDEWERLGNIGWGYEDVLPLFKLSEGIYFKFSSKYCF